MRPPTVVVSAEALAGESLELRGETYRHLFRSRRLPAGARLRLVDGRGRARWGEVATVSSRRAGVTLGETAPNNEPALAVELWVALPRPRRASWLVEKATEVGVAAIRWVDSSRGGRDLSAAALERHLRIARAAVEQSGRATVPRITGLHGLDELLGEPVRTVPTWVLDREEGVPIDRGRLAGASAVRFVVGPEGGFEPDEIGGLIDAGATGLSLGSRVLRVETAAVLAVGLVLATAGDGSPEAL